MAKYHYEQRTFHETFHLPAAPTSPPQLTTQIATRSFSDTHVRSIWQPRVICEIDDTVSPPPDNWWTGSRVDLAIRFDAAGTSGSGSGPFAPTVLGNIELYPRTVPPTAVNGLHYVVWEPLDGPTKLTTSRKGDGVHFPRVNSSMWCTDHNGVFQNFSGIYSVFFSIMWTGLVVWASDSP